MEIPAQCTAKMSKICPKRKQLYNFIILYITGLRVKFSRTSTHMYVHCTRNVEILLRTLNRNKRKVYSWLEQVIKNASGTFLKTSSWCSCLQIEENNATLYTLKLLSNPTNINPLTFFTSHIRFLFYVYKGRMFGSNGQTLENTNRSHE